MKAFTTFTQIKMMAVAMLLAFTFALTSTSNVQAQDEDDKFSMSVSLNSDIFFGFYPFFAGSYAIGDATDFTFYGILWSGGGFGFAWGNWTEFGVGLNFEVAEGININPQIGLLSGSLTSSGGPGQSVLGEGFVPNVTIGIDKESIEGEIYAGLYTGLNHGAALGTHNYLHWWANGGIKFTPFFSAGLHLEHLRFMGGSEYESDDAYDYYFALGPYVQFADPNGGAFARFTTGGDLRGDEMVEKSEWAQPSFFKLTVGYSF